MVASLGQLCAVTGRLVQPARGKCTRILPPPLRASGGAAPVLASDGAAPRAAAALRGRQPPQSVPASTLREHGRLGEVALGQATSCFEAAADHGGLVRGVAVLPPDHAAGAAARPPQLEGESQVATLLSSRTSTCAPLPRRTRWPPACRPARPSSSALSASPRGSSAAPYLRDGPSAQTPRPQPRCTPRPTPCPATLAPWPLPPAPNPSPNPDPKPHSNPKPQP